MNPVSFIILLLIIAYCAFVIYKQVQKKNNTNNDKENECKENK